MSLLKSLFCLKGKDNRERFALITVGSICLFSLLSMMLSNNPIFLLIITTPLIAGYATSCIRRCNDAGLSSHWQYTPTVLFVVSVIIIAFTENTAFNLLLAFPFITNLFLLTYKARDNKSTYQYGYNGPVDIIAPPSYQQASVTRVEPTLIGSASPSMDTAYIDGNNTASNINESVLHQANPATSQQDIGENIRAFLVTHKVKALIGVGVFGLIILTLLIIGNTEQTTEQEDTKKIESIVQNDDFTTLYNLVTLEDGFTVASNAYQGIVISWQADDTLRSELWDNATAKGDNTCQQLTFNNKSTIRTAKVFVKNNSNYLAVFSPLDRSELINQLAKRGSFKLCGYDFSLKGSQAALGKVRYYGEILNY